MIADVTDVAPPVLPLQARLAPGSAARGTPLVRATPSSPQLLELFLERRRVGVEHPFGEVLADTDRARPDDRRRQGDARREEPFFLALLRSILEVLRELLFEGAADLLAVAAEFPERLLDLLRQQLRRQLVLFAGDRPLRPPEQALRATQRDEGAARGNAGSLRRRLPDPRGDIRGRSSRGLESLELFLSVRAGRYDLRESGIRARAHSIVSFVMSIVLRGMNRSLRSSVSMPRRETSTPISALQA